MSDVRTLRQFNRELATKINEEVLRNPQSLCAHKYVGIANGQVVAIADDLDELDQRLEQVEPDPTKCFCIEASRDYTQVEYIWSL